MRYFVCLLLASFVLSCTVKQKNVLMIPRREENGVVKLYFDRDGNLYPSEVHVTPYYFYLDNLKIKRKQKTGEYATIESALTKYDSLSKLYVSQRYQLPLQDSIKLFTRLQEILRKAAVGKMEQRMIDNNNRQLIILIHGFNDPTPDAFYYALRKEILDYLKVKPTFVEVYWDGLNALGDYILMPSIWNYSQQNAAKVGLGLRNVLKDVDSSTTIYLLTHSLGSSVATNVLFNQQKWPTDFQEILKSDYHSGEIKTLWQKEIRLGMIAPAISGVETFKDIDNTVPSGKLPQLSKVVIGFNHYDYAVTKGGLFPHWFGSTALGADANKEVGKTFTVLNNKAPQVQCFAVNFSLTKKGLKDTKENKIYRQKDHSMIAYQANEHFEDFMSLVFGN